MSNVVSLKEHLEAKIKAVDRSARERAKAQDKAVSVALVGAKEDIEKVAKATEERFKSVNEFRQTLTDQARTFMPRLESEQMHKATLARNDAEYKAQTARIDNLMIRMNAYDERSKGKTEGWGSIAAVISVAALVVTLIMVFVNFKS